MSAQKPDRPKKTVKAALRNDSDEGSSDRTIKRNARARQIMGYRLMKAGADPDRGSEGLWFVPGLA
jgi:hypothetical protein